MTRPADQPATKKQLPSGVRLPDVPQADLDALDLALHYVTFYVHEYARARQVVKRRASTVVVLTAAGYGAIAVVGAVTAIAKAPWLGIVSTALTGFIGVLAAWDGLFRHRDLWTQRSAILGQLQALQRTIEVRRAAGEQREALAIESARRLDLILAEDISTWLDLRRSNPPESANTVSASPSGVPGTPPG